MTKLEQVYGGALYDLALEEGLTGAILKELEQIVALFDANPDYWRFLSTLSIAKQERCAALDEAFQGRIQPYLLNFLKLLCEKGAADRLRGCAQEYRRRYQEDNGILTVRAVTAVALSPALRDKLQKKLEATLEKTVELQCRVDPQCMGGVLLELPGRQLDGTVRHRLDALSKTLQTASV